MPSEPILVPDGEYQLAIPGYFLRVENGKATLVPEHEVPHLGSLLPVVPVVPKPTLYEKLISVLKSPALKRVAGAVLVAAVLAANAYVVVTHPVSCVYVPPAPAPDPSPKPAPRPPWIPPTPPSPPAPTPDPMGGVNVKGASAEAPGSVTRQSLRSPETRLAGAILPPSEPPAPVATAVAPPPQPAAAPPSYYYYYPAQSGYCTSGTCYR